MYSGVFNVADFYNENQNMGLTNLEIFLYFINMKTKLRNWRNKLITSKSMDDKNKYEIVKILVTKHV